METILEKNRTVPNFFLGTQPFTAVREIQDGLVTRRIRGEIDDTILFCEHPPTLSLGRRTCDADLCAESDLAGSVDSWAGRGVEVVRADRGGGPTYHGPGQLLIYPVCSLRGIGPRRFVAGMLEEIAAVLHDLGVESELRLDSVGLWVAGQFGRRKIAAVGLRIVRGVTNHGFSLNVNCDLRPFSLFHPCGVQGLEVTSIAELTGQSAVSPVIIAERLSKRFGSD